ncbi:MAG TPA: right-handed parallel beta-helix repeat-containing protein [Capsulimonadaceae bacterium]|jgi:hypothetical protein
MHAPNNRVTAILAAIALAASVALAMPARTVAADLGPLPPEIAAWTDAVKDQQRTAGHDLIARIAAAAKAGEKLVTVPKGDYRFKDEFGPRRVHFILSGLTDMTIDFQGSTLWFDSETPGIAIAKCKNTTLRNVKLDWDPLVFMQGTVTAIDKATSTFDIKLDPGYDKVAPGLAKGGSGWRGIAFNKDDRELKAEQGGFVVSFSWDNRTPDGAYRVKYGGFYGVPIDKSGISVGDPMVILSRMGRAVLIENTDHLTLEDVTLYSSPFVAFAAANGRDLVFRRCHILRRPGTNRLLAGNADGINTSDMDNGPMIDSCTMETIGDDFVNVHAQLARVLAQENPTTIITSPLNGRGVVATPVMIEFFERETMAPLGARMATADVISQWTIDKATTLADLAHKWHSGEAAALDYGKTVSARRLTLDKPIEIKGDVIVACQAFSSAGAVIKNCSFKGSLARGIRLQSPGARIENNTIARTGGAGLTMYGHASFWGEGPYVHDAIVTGNTFDDVAIMTSAPGTERAALVIREGDSFHSFHIPHDIRIENNTFRHSGGQAIVARGVDNLTVTGNRIEDYANREAFPPRPNTVGDLLGSGSAITIEAVTGLTLRDNKAIRPGKYAKGEAIVTLK